MENAGYFFAAYAVIWALVFGYVGFLVKRQADLKKEIQSLQEDREKENAV